MAPRNLLPRFLSGRGFFVARPQVDHHPSVELHDGNGTLLRFNDNWRSEQEAEIAATGIPPQDDRESAMVETLPRKGAGYTAVVRSANGTNGVALVEVYSLD